VDRQLIFQVSTESNEIADDTLSHTYARARARVSYSNSYTSHMLPILMAHVFVDE